MRKTEYFTHQLTKINPQLVSRNEVTSKLPSLQVMKKLPYFIFHSLYILLNWHTEHILENFSTFGT